MPAIKKPSEHFDVLTWTGTGGGSGATRSITGLNFQPDFIWEKARSSGSGHQLLDSVRGVGQNKVLASNSSGDEPEAPNTESLYGWLSAINSDGFTLTNGTSTFDNWNKSADTYVSWQWKAGGTAVTNTSGTISSQVSANPTAGFSVVTYTGTGSNATVGHGLGVAPKMIFVKSRSNGGTYYDWAVYNSDIGAGNAMLLNSTSGSFSKPSYWNSTTATSTVFTLGSDITVNQSSATYVAYCFAQIAGYSAFGSYTGNGSSDGPFIYTGFRPRFVMWKNSTQGSQWILLDTARNTYNVLNTYLEPNTADVDNTASTVFDMLSNGFKLRNAGGTDFNENANIYIYMAFAEAPFKYSSAR